MHRMMIQQVIPDTGQSIVIDGDEAEHAVRVKRVESGEAVALMDGSGVIAHGVVERVERSRRGTGPAIEVRIHTRHESAFPGVAPSVEVFTACPKGGRLDDMIDGLSQVGASGWSPLDTARGVVEPRDTKLARLERIAHEAAKQCARPWTLRIGPLTTMEQALTPATPADARIVIADATGEPWRAEASRAGIIRLLVGPEGGWTADELRIARQSGAAVTRFGPHTMRIETAAVAACAVLMASGHAT